MKTTTTQLTTTVVCSEDGHDRYLLQKTWDDQLPKLTAILLTPSTAAGVVLDTTTQHVLRNAVTLGFGSVSIVNLFATIGDYALRQSKAEDPDNLDAIVAAARLADVIVYAPGTGKAKNKVFQRRVRQVLEGLQPFEKKLYCLSNADGKARLQHPLSPAVHTWTLSPLRIEEVCPEAAQVQLDTKGKPQPKAPKKSEK